MHFDAWSIVRKHWEYSRRERGSKTLSGRWLPLWENIESVPERRKGVQNTTREITSTVRTFQKRKGSKTLSAGERGRKVSRGMETCCAKGNQGSKEMRSQSEEGGVKDGRKDYGARNTFLLVNIRKYISYMRILFGSGLFSLILWRGRWWLWWWRCGWRSIIRACLIDCNGHKRCWWWRGGGYQLDILPVMPTVSTNNAIRRYNTIIIAITIKQQ